MFEYQAMSAQQLLLAPSCKAAIGTPLDNARCSLCFQWRNCCAISQVDARRPSLQKRIMQHTNRFNVGLAIGWLVLIALGLFISTCTLKEAENFDPFEILGIDTTADKVAIKKAYKSMSRIHHPDKVSDPVKKKEAGRLLRGEAVQSVPHAHR